MSLAQALLYPLRNPALFILVVLVHCLAWSIALAEFDYSTRYFDELVGTMVLIQRIVVLVLYGIWLQRRAIATLKRLSNGGRSLPPLRIADFLPLRIRSVFSTLFVFWFVALFMLVIQELRTDLWAHIVAVDASDVFEAVHLLARFAICLVALSLLTLLYVVGLARYATEGEGRVAAQRIADELGLPENTRRTCQYLLLQFLLLGGAVYLLEHGIAISDALRPPWQSFAPESDLAWRTFGIFAFACGLVMVWNACLHLLAQYASAIGIRVDDNSLEKAKNKRGVTQESAGA